MLGVKYAQTKPHNAQIPIDLSDSLSAAHSMAAAIVRPPAFTFECALAMEPVDVACTVAREPSKRKATQMAEGGPDKQWFSAQAMRDHRFAFLESHAASAFVTTTSSSTGGVTRQQ